MCNFIFVDDKHQLPASNQGLACLIIIKLYTSREFRHVCAHGKVIIISCKINFLQNWSEPNTLLWPTSCLGLLYKSRCSLGYISKGSSTVRLSFVELSLNSPTSPRSDPGLYSGIFAKYLQHQASENKTKSFLFYALCTLYVLSLATVVLDITTFINGVSSNFVRNNNNLFMLSVVQILITQNKVYPIYVISGAIIGSCDFISQCILVRINHDYHLLYSSKSSKIYRCWVVWNRNIRVVTIPSILALAFLG